MAAPEPVSPDVQEFIENMGVYFERYALPRIGGRILGLLLVADTELTLDDIASMLDVSKASVSTNLRLILVTGLAQRVTKRGDRRDYYRFSPNAWEQGIQADIDGTAALGRLAERGLVALRGAEGTASHHLQELTDFCDFMLEERRGSLERWHQRNEAKLAKKH
jgi:DNA-binding transcriptional regulator GbsR (MarR family)